MSSKFIPKIILVFSLLGVYLATLAPGLTWANQGADGGDLITAAATGGIAHPSGYPTYLILARLFQFVPVGSLAFRTNLMSALFAVCAALVVYEISNASHNWLASLTAAFAFGLSPLFWSQAVITEVYTLHILFIAILLFLSVKEKNHFLLGMLCGLALGNHITTIFLLPLLFHRDKKILAQRLVGLALGLAVYLTLPLRAAVHPPVNWGNPVTLENFIWLVSGKLYQGQLFTSSFAALWERVQIAAALFLDQFGFVGLLTGFVGLVVCFKLTRLNLSLMWISLAFFIFPLAYDTKDSFIYLLPTFLCFAIWIGIGLDSLMESIARYAPGWDNALPLILLALILIRAGGHWSQVDASHDARAENFGAKMMSEIPQNAITFAEGDQAVLTLWYFQHTLKERPDLIIVASELLPNEWYQGVLHYNYPDLKLPGEFFMFPEEIIAYNPDRTICRIGYGLELECEEK